MSEKDEIVDMVYSACFSVAAAREALKNNEHDEAARHFDTYKQLVNLIVQRCRLPGALDEAAAAARQRTRRHLAYRPDH